MFKAEIISDLCNGCGACVSACPLRALSLNLGTDNRKKASVKQDVCTGCGACIPSCRYKALRLV